MLEDILFQYGPQGLGIAIIVAVVRIIEGWWQNRRDNARLRIEQSQTAIKQQETDARTLDVAMKSLESAITTNHALQQQITGLQGELLKYNARAIKQQDLIDTVRDELVAARKDANTATTQLGNELVRVKGQLHQANNRIAELERQLEAKDAQIKAQDKKISLLKDELEKSEGERQAQQAELSALRERLNGKVDKPIESGERAPDVAEEANHDGKSRTMD